PGAAGRWRDAATGEHGDLRGLIAEVRKLPRFRDAAGEARTFLQLPIPAASHRAPASARNSSTAARRLFAASVPLNGTIAERYLRNRGIVDLHGCSMLRFHPRCYYRESAHAPPTTHP